MANKYTQIHLHIIFAVKNRMSLLPALHLPRIHAYMGGILRQHGHIPIAVGGINNHVHILITYDVRQTVSDMIRDVKSSTSRYINENRLTPYHFEWQNGYGCFSYSHSQIDAVANYIYRQYEHHKSISFDDEIKNIMDKLGIQYDPQYMMRQPE